MLVLPGVLASLPLEEVIALRGVKRIAERHALTLSGKVLQRKEAIVQVSDSLPCCWREASLFSDLDSEKRLVHRQHLIFNSSIHRLGTEMCSAEIHSLWIVQPGQTVTEYNSII